MKRIAFIAGVTILASSCNAPDGPLGAVVPGAGTADSPITSATVLARTDLGTLGGPSSYATDVNISDVVVGWSETSAGTMHAFRWTATDGMVDLGTLPGDPSSQAVAILDGRMPGGGLILGVSGDVGRWTPVVWSPSGVIAPLPIPLLAGASFGYPTGANVRGDIVGWDDADFGQHAWIWSESAGKYDLTANAPVDGNEGSAFGITPSGVVALTAQARDMCGHTLECWRTYLWSAGTGYVPLGTPGDDHEITVAGLGLNQGGTVVGWLAKDGAGGGAYRWDAGSGFTMLPHYAPDGALGYASAVNVGGTAVGAEPNAGTYVATAWPVGGGILRLSPDDPNPSVAVAINAQATIAGWAVVADGVNHAVVWSRSSQVAGLRSDDATPARAHAPPASTPCLGNARAISSRRALFACVTEAGRSR